MVQAIEMCNKEIDLHFVSVVGRTCRRLIHFTCGSLRSNLYANILRAAFGARASKRQAFGFLRPDLATQCHLI